MARQFGSSARSRARKQFKNLGQAAACALAGAIIAASTMPIASAASALASPTDAEPTQSLPEPIRLLAANASLSEHLSVRRGENGARLVFGWGPASSLKIDLPLALAKDEEYFVGVLLDHASGPDAAVELRAGNDVARFMSRASGKGLRYRAARLMSAGPITIRQGVRDLQLTISASGAGALELGVFSVELMRSSDVRTFRALVAEHRVDTDAFVALGYGFMVHYTPEAFPRSGPRRAFVDAVRAFDVDSFAAQMERGGAGFVVLVTAHMKWMFPAPLRTVDAQIPGRTTDRDLIADLERALSERGIRLILYVNPARDAEFRARLGDGDMESTRFLQAWFATLTELGERYGSRVFGYWFDLGPWFYENAPSWEALRRVTRVGNPDRIVAWNRSRLPALTEFQDFESCEKCDDPSADGYLLASGDGRYVGGPSVGMQAAATLLGEHPPEGESADPWVHRWQDKEIGPPRWSAADLALLLDDFRAHRNVPIFNLGIYQEGIVSARSIEVFAQAGRLRKAACTP